jgi:hypothetical protein
MRRKARAVPRGDVDVLVQVTGDGTIKVATVTKANDQTEGVLTKFKGEIAVLGVVMMATKSRL